MSNPDWAGILSTEGLVTAKAMPVPATDFAPGRSDLRLEGQYMSGMEAHRYSQSERESWPLQAGPATRISGVGGVNESKVPVSVFRRAFGADYETQLIYYSGSFPLITAVHVGLGGPELVYVPYDVQPIEGLLQESLEELDGVCDEAREDGYPIPGQLAIRNAENTLKRLHDARPGRYSVSPTETGDVAITVPVSGLGNAMTIECDSDGGLLCFVNVGGAMRRMKDYDADMAWTSSNFIAKALADLRAFDSGSSWKT